MSVVPRSCFTIGLRLSKLLGEPCGENVHSFVSFGDVDDVVHGVNRSASAGPSGLL